MGNAVKTFATNIAKSAAKGIISYAGGHIPLIGGPLANWINSKFAKGSYDIGALNVPNPDNLPTKLVSTPAQLKSLVKQYPDMAVKSGLTIEKIDEEVKKAKEEGKPSMAVGGKVKAKKPRSAAQLAATKKLVEANRLRRQKK